VSAIGQTPVLADMGTVLLLAFGLLRLGHGLLDLLRDLREFREGD
jgi:hypothetical protein